MIIQIKKSAYLSFILFFILLSSFHFFPFNNLLFAENIECRISYKMPHYSALTNKENRDKKQDCGKSCDDLYEQCMNRINDAEKCGFARLDCLNICEKN